MKTVYIILNGNLSQKISQIKLQKFDLIICADGGAELAKKSKILPNIIIGDCDSISQKTKEYFEKKCVAFLKYPREKDFTDSELAIDYALKSKAQKLVIYGFFGDRIDHMLSNLYQLANKAKKVQTLFIEENTEMQFISSVIIFKGKKGDELSLIPLKDDVVGVSTQGLYYPLKDENLPFGTTRGISNVFTDKVAEVSVKKGLLLAVHRKIT